MTSKPEGTELLPACRQYIRRNPKLVIMAAAYTGRSLVVNLL